MKYRDLIEDNPNPSYSNLLNCEEWLEKRNKIVSKYHNRCCNCNKEGPDDYIPQINGNFVKLVPVRIDAIEEKRNIPGVGEVEMWDLKPVFTELNEEYIMDVHHTYYVLTRLPWEYQDETLKLLCRPCHLKTHSTEKIPCFLTEEKKNKVNLTPCDRCGGIGILSEYHYHLSGVCFKCSGAKYLELIK